MPCVERSPASVRSKCAEIEDAPVERREPFSKLRCHIDISTNYLHDGVAKSLVEEFEKKSETLGRNARFVKTSAIARLPEYLLVQFMRFGWRNDTHQKAKILRVSPRASIGAASQLAESPVSRQMGCFVLL